jgi:hypothetical protein
VPQKRMSEKEIQSFEGGDETQVLAYFASMTGAQAGELFVQLLRSYRDAARVANAAWLVRDEYQRAWLEAAGAHAAQHQLPEPKVKDVAAPWGVRAEAYKRLTDALQLYAPMNFPPTQYVHDFAVQTLAGVCDTLTRFATVHEAVAWVADYTNRLRNARWYQGGETG